MKAHTELSLCRDVSNVTKHFTLTRQGSQKCEISMIREYSPPNTKSFAGGYYDGDVRLVIVGDDKSYEVGKLARACLELWRVYSARSPAHSVLANSMEEPASWPRVSHPSGLCRGGALRKLALPQVSGGSREGWGSVTGIWVNCTKQAFFVMLERYPRVPYEFVFQVIRTKSDNPSFAQFRS